MSDSDSNDYVDIANENLETDDEVDDLNEVDEARNNNSGRYGRQGCSTPPKSVFFRNSEFLSISLAPRVGSRVGSTPSHANV